jgi:hypothetical protein
MFSLGRSLAGADEAAARSFIGREADKGVVVSPPREPQRSWAEVEAKQESSRRVAWLIAEAMREVA